MNFNYFNNYHNSINFNDLTFLNQLIARHEQSTYLNFPQSFAAGSGGSTGPARRPQKHVLLLLVLVHRQKLFLLGVKQSHDVATLQDFLLVLTMFHEQGHLPGGGRVHDIDFLAAGIIAQFIIRSHVETLPTRVHRLHNHFIADDDAVAVASQLVERHYVQPRALIPVRVQVNPHRVFLQQRRQPLVHRQEFIGLEMQQLRYRNDR